MIFVFPATELMRQLPALVCPSLAVLQPISVPCEEQTLPYHPSTNQSSSNNTSLDNNEENNRKREANQERDEKCEGNVETPTESPTQEGSCNPTHPSTTAEGERGRRVVIAPPCSHIPPSPIMCYLLSDVWRTGMVRGSGGGAGWGFI